MSKGVIASIFNFIKAKERYIYNDNGTVIDTGTNLMWELDGMPLIPKGDKVSKPFYDACGFYIPEPSFIEAIEYSKNLRLGGYPDWRLPTIYELKSIVDDRYMEPCTALKYTDCDSGYWSIEEPDDTSTLSATYGMKFNVYFSHKTFCVNKARCVRHLKHTRSIIEILEELDEAIKERRE